MAILFAGTSLSDMEINAGSVLVTNTSQIGPNVAEGFNTDNSGKYSKTPEFPTPVDDLWLSWYFYCGNNNNGTYNTCLVLGPAGVSLMRVTCTSGNFTLQVYRSGAWVTLVASALIIPSAVMRIDLHCKLAASGGVVEIYANGALYATYTGNTAPTSGTTMHSVSFSCVTIGGTAVHSSMIAADEDTRGLTFVQRLPTGNGALTQWTGSYTDIDETGINDADFITPSAAGQISTFTFPTLPSQYTDYDVRAVVLSGRAQAGASDPTLLDMVARIGGTNYFEAPATVPPAFAGIQVVYNDNPATGVPWTRAQVDAAQFGFRAVA